MLSNPAFEIRGGRLHPLNGKSHLNEMLEDGNVLFNEDFEFCVAL